MKKRTDLAILGGGLAGGLIALAMQRLRPDIDVTLIEQGRTLGGNHLWSYFSTDVAPGDAWLVAPLVCHGWPGYTVHFPDHDRAIDALYYTIESERLDTVLRQRLAPEDIMTNTRIIGASAHHVLLSNDVRIEAKGVIDCRGGGNVTHFRGGWQKFMGQMLHLSEPHGLTRPIIMDATVDQIDGYRFVYCLPISPVEVFVEDTYYSDWPKLDTQQLSARISRYAANKGWQVDRVTRTEVGAIPVVNGGSFSSYWQSSGESMAKAGVRAALFHDLTSYSLPDAVRFALALADQKDLTGNALVQFTHDYAQRHWKRGKYYRMLNKMLFGAALPHKRFAMLRHFYRKPAKLIARFYAGQSTIADKLRILTGRPPVSIMRAVAALAAPGRSIIPDGERVNRERANRDV